MTHYFGYIRVSTAKQGEQGVSLEQQKDAILRFADRQSIRVHQWFEERETAAKRGRPIFADMMRLLRGGKAAGVIVHKIDRSARNLWDWAELGQLIDLGIDVRFASEDLDLRTRGGRLSADIQAVVAADYVRNLREETKKGINGRLKQGFLPFPAPLGYLNQGAGKAKIPDPASAPFVRRAFELYDSGSYSLRSLLDELRRLGLRNQRGNAVSLNGLSTILRNPFYSGLINIRRSGETYRGVHEPLVSPGLYQRVQERLGGKAHRLGFKHHFLFRRLIKCKSCERALIGELQKGHVYYRCQTSGCATKTVREEVVLDVFLQRLALLEVSAAERAHLDRLLTDLRENWARNSKAWREARQLQLTQVNDRLDRLTDAYVDRLLDRENYLKRKGQILLQQKELEHQAASASNDHNDIPRQIAALLELATSALRQYKQADLTLRHRLIEFLTSNRTYDGRNVEFAYSEPFHLVAERATTACGAPDRGTPRTMADLLANLVKFFKEHSSFMDKWQLPSDTKS